MGRLRYTISRYDTIPIPEIDPNVQPKYIKRFILYDHYGERIVSEPFEERSPQHEAMIQLMDDMNVYEDGEFIAYNMEMMDYIGITTFSPRHTYKHIETIDLKEKNN